MCEQINFMDDLLSGYHVLMGGVAGSGKTTLLQEMVREIQRRYSPEKVDLILIETRGAEWEDFTGVPHLLYEKITDVEDALCVLEEVQEKVKVRLIARKDTPRMIVMLDEFAPLMLRDSDRLERIVQYLTTFGRKAGVQLVFSTQFVYPEVLTGLLRAHFPCRVAFRVPGETESRLLLDAPGAENLQKPGDMLFLPIQAEAPVQIHVPLTEKA